MNNLEKIVHPRQLFVFIYQETADPGKQPQLRKKVGAAVTVIKYS
jgi:hypothetical protein